MIEGADRSVTGFKNNVPFASDFAAVKSFDQDPLPAQCRMVDELAQTPIGVEVTQSCTFPRPDKASTVWTVSVTPRSRSLSGLAAGYLLDWDIGSGGRLNRISPDDEAIPADLRGGNVAAHRITRQGFPVSICVAVVSSDRDDRAQSACMLYGTFIDDGDGFSHSDMVRFLTSGTTIVESGEGDVCGVIGMSRELPLDVGQTWTFSVIIAVGNDVEQARSVMRETLPTVGVTSDELAGIDQRIVPNPVTELATVRGTAKAGRCAVIDVLGRERLVWTHSSGGDVTFDASSLEKGAYTLRIQDASTRQTRHLRFLR